MQKKKVVIWAWYVNILTYKNDMHLSLNRNTMYIQEDWFIIRDFHKDDIPRLRLLADNYNIYINLTYTFPHPYTLKDAEWRVNHNISLWEKAESFAIEVNWEFAWSCWIRHKWWDQWKTWNIGYRLGEEYRWKWLASKICKSIVNYGFNTFDAIRIEAWVFWWNPASMKVLEKNGFIREWTLRNRIWKDWKSTDEVFFSILRSEFIT